MRFNETETDNTVGITVDAVIPHEDNVSWKEFKIFVSVLSIPSLFGFNLLQSILACPMRPRANIFEDLKLISAKSLLDHWNVLLETTCIIYVKLEENMEIRERIVISESLDITVGHILS